MSVLRALASIGNQLAIVTRAGWATIAAATMLWLAGTALGWGEMRVAALALLVLVSLSLAVTVGGLPVRLQVRADPVRMRVGQQGTVTIEAVNPGTRALRPAHAQLPIGDRLATVALPRLVPGERHTESFDVSAQRRGVIVAGPVTTVRGDPFGLARRVVSGSNTIEVFVHPDVVKLAPLDAGLVRDLEGRATNDPSSSDLDFHTLRGYDRGDERRHIHWRSSARASAARGSTTLLVKSYTDTRRSHLGVLVDARADRYADAEAFETAIVAAASVATRALRDEIDVTVVAGEHAMDRVGVVQTLDGFSRVEPTELGLSEMGGVLVGLAPATSIVLLVTGAEHPFTELRRATSRLPPAVRVVILRIAPGRSSGTSAVHGMTVLTLGQVSDLPRLITLEVAS